jgi:uncharacterized membrane protein YfcA
MPLLAPFVPVKILIPVVVDGFNFDIIRILVVAVPMMLLGLYLGNRIHGLLGEVGFRRLISARLFATGLPLVLR